MLEKRTITLANASKSPPHLHPAQIPERREGLVDDVELVDDGRVVLHRELVPAFEPRRRVSVVASQVL
jgi:hypothetical protein